MGGRRHSMRWIRRCENSILTITTNFSHSQCAAGAYTNIFHPSALSAGQLIDTAAKVRPRHDIRSVCSRFSGHADIKITSLSTLAFRPSANAFSRQTADRPILSRLGCWSIDVITDPIAGNPYKGMQIRIIFGARRFQSTVSNWTINLCSDWCL